jgi:hypothetical protein
MATEVLPVTRVTCSKYERLIAAVEELISTHSIIFGLAFDDKVTAMNKEEEDVRIRDIKYYVLHQVQSYSDAVTTCRRSIENTRDVPEASLAPYQRALTSRLISIDGILGQIETLLADEAAVIEKYLNRSPPASQCAVQVLQWKHHNLQDRLWNKLQELKTPIAEWKKIFPKPTKEQHPEESRGGAYRIVQFAGRLIGLG